MALNNNLIAEIENVKYMKGLISLNLSDNKINDYNVEEIPENVVILYLKGN